MAPKSLTVPERILLAAFDLGADGKAFTAEELVVRAWRIAPEHFGLQGYVEKYPDSNRVLTKLMGKDSVLRQKGWLRKVGTKRYRLTEPGRLAAEEIKVEGEPVGMPHRLSALDRRLIYSLNRMLESAAFAKHSHSEVLTFSDVCAFWNISPRSTAHQLATQVELADTAVRLALEATRNGHAQVTLPGSSVVIDRSDIEKLADLSVHLRERFARELAVIRGRTDERRL